MPRLRTRRPIFALATALLLAAPARPQGSPANPAPPGTDPAAAAFQGADTNKDGMLSREEAGKLTTLVARFDELDKNKDGALSFEEFRAGWRAAP